MTKAEYGDAIGRAFKFAIKPKLLVFIYFLNLVLFASFAGLFYWFYRAGGGVTGGFDPGAGTLLVFVLGVMSWIIVLALVMVMVTMILVDHYKRKKSLGESFKHVKSMYLRMLGVTLVVALISSVVGMVPYIGFIFSIIVGIIFLFVTQHVVIAKKRFGDVFESSWELFRKETGDVVLTWIIATLIQLAVVFIFAIPLIVMAIGMIIAMASGAGDFTAFAGSLLANIALLVVGGLIMLIGMTISSLFNIGFLTDVYIQLRKKVKF